MITPLDMPWPRDTRYLRIGDLLLDLRNRRVEDAGSEVVLPQRIFDLLSLLLAEPHELHSRAELFERLWPGLVVEDANLTQSVWLLRKALGDARKDWIRTVAGAGYVFEPPGPVEAFIERPASPGSSDAREAEGPVSTSAVAPAASDEAPTLPTSRLHRSSSARRFRWLRPWIGWSVVAALLISTGIWAIWHAQRAEQPMPVAAVPLTVALVEVEDSATDSHWPVLLLHDWLGWKLRSLPEVTLLTEAELAADTSTAPPTVVLLSSGGDPGNPGRIVLRARFQQPAGEQRIEARGAIAEVPDMVDKLSREIVKRLTPGRGEPWPTLQLHADAARRYADLAAAMRRRDWIAAASVADEVVKLAPHFGLARLQQAKAKSALSQGPEAIESMDRAYTLLQPAPSDVVALLDAQRLAANPEPQSQRKAMEAYAALFARHPRNSAITLDYASLLLETVQIEKAVRLLTSHTWDRESMGTRIQRLLMLSRAYGALGDSQRAEQNAQGAERLARAAGKDWNRERGAALLQVASLDQGADQARRGALFEQAAQLFEESGNRTGALYARFKAEATRAPTPDQELRVNALLAQARAGGYRSLELTILMVAANQAHRVGDIDRYRDYLAKALAVGEASGDTGRRNVLEVAVVYEDLMQLRYSSAQKRIERLKRQGLEGHTAAMLWRMEAGLADYRGESTRSRNILTDGERQLAALQPDADRISAAQAELACAKIEGDLALGDLSGARGDSKRCASTANSYFGANARLLDANIQRVAGDMTAAQAQLRQVRSALARVPDEPDRESTVLTLAALLTRTGDIAGSDRLYRDLKSKQPQWGYLLLAAQAETGLAENAAARGDWPNALQHVAAARRDLPADDWSLRYRLDVVDVAAALAKGDTARATSIAVRTHAQAHQLGDAVAQMELHSLMPVHAFPECTLAIREALIARTGMRGATLTWLTARLPGNPASP